MKDKLYKMSVTSRVFLHFYYLSTSKNAKMKESQINYTN